MFVVCLALIAATLFFGAEVKGARRWIVLAGVNIQPSEFLKPAFVILIAWLFAESTRKPDMPANTIALALLAAVVVAARAAAGFRPDHADRAGLGRAVLHGRHAHDLGHRARRQRRRSASPAPISSFRTSPGASTASSIRPPATPSRSTNAIESFVRGGWFGRGPGEGTVKRILPDSHTDFVFAVAAEEFGIVLCLALVALFAFIVIRALLHALRDDDPFTRFAVRGPRDPVRHAVGDQHGGEPAPDAGQGHDLPFISYGGSSMISLAYGMGMLLALTRERPRVAMLEPTERLPPEWKPA